jgi:hypothetical protein
VVKITNSKLLPDGRFRHFPGFSLLFDNPGIDAHAPLGDYVWLTDDQKDAPPCPSFYGKLNTCLDNTLLMEPNSGHSFFDLPVHSYHVTVWDGLNVANRKKVYWAFQPDLADFLLDLPAALRVTSRFTARPESSPLVGPCDIAFQFDQLTIFGKSVLVALLKPADGYERAKEQIDQHRVQLYEEFQRETGLYGWRRKYGAHVSLGYFGDKKSARKAEDHKEDWTGKFAEEMDNEPIRFTSISLYGFVDMETFFKST